MVLHGRQSGDYAGVGVGGRWWTLVGVDVMTSIQIQYSFFYHLQNTFFPTRICTGRNMIFFL